MFTLLFRFLFLLVVAGLFFRWKKRKSFPSVLWNVIVKCDDICFTHILPKLNQTDLKFLYEVNEETRKLIKRSTRADDLKKSFEVQEMSSISTLEIAWENISFWRSEYFC